MPLRRKRWAVLGLLALAGLGVLAITTLPYLPLVHGTTSGEVERLAAWLLIIDFEPGGIMNWIGRPETADRHGGHGTPEATVVREVTAAGFQLMRGPERWRGRLYVLLFRRP